MYVKNGYAEPSRLLLGTGDLYVNDVYVGNLKGSVTFTSTPSFAFQRPGNLVADIVAQKTAEEVTLEAEICDLKIDQLKIALGTSNVVDVTTPKEFRVREIITLAAAPVTFGKTAIPASITVTKLDRSVVYAETTDYTIATNAITRVPAGAIADGESVIVEYNYEDSTAKSIAYGGEACAPTTYRVDYTHSDCNGKYWQITLFKAFSSTEFEMAFNERESGDYTIHNLMFRALVDLTKVEGSNLYEIREEAGAA